MDQKWHQHNISNANTARVIEDGYMSYIQITIAIYCGISPKFIWFTTKARADPCRIRVKNYSLLYLIIVVSSFPTSADICVVTPFADCSYSLLLDKTMILLPANFYFYTYCGALHSFCYNLNILNFNLRFWQHIFNVELSKYVKQINRIFKIVTLCYYLNSARSTFPVLYKILRDHHCYSKTRSFR